MVLKWEDPPEPPKGVGRPSRYKRIAEELRAHPGEWALIAKGDNPSMATNIRSATIAAFRPPHSFEAVTSNKRMENGRMIADTHARYVGEQEI
jgi:hypothetical protein